MFWPNFSERIKTTRFASAIAGPVLLGCLAAAPLCVAASVTAREAPPQQIAAKQKAAKKSTRKGAAPARRGADSPGPAQPDSSQSAQTPASTPPPASAQAPPARPEATPTAQPADADAKDSRRLELNLLGKVNVSGGESRRNENIHFNLIDNNALKEMNVRLGTTATIVQEFQPERRYFGAELGNAPASPIHLAAAATPKPGGLFQRVHGRLHESHFDSLFSARSFFQVGVVQPAHDNDYGFSLGSQLGRATNLMVSGIQQKSRGSVNGNVLVPEAGERTPLATDPAVSRIVARWLSAYPKQLPNRTDINPRMLNTNSPQQINNDNATARLDQQIGSDRISGTYQFTGQNVDAFEFVAGQNPDTTTKAHRARLTWSRTWSERTVSDVSAGFDRVTSNLRPDADAVGPYITVSGLEALGPTAIIPIRRAQNLYQYAALMRHAHGRHQLTAGAALTRRQFNGLETDAHRPYFGFAADFGRTGIANFRTGTPTQYIISIGDTDRGFRNLEMQAFVGDRFAATRDLTFAFGLRYQPVTRPHEVNGRNAVPYHCSCSDVSPSFGVAWRLPNGLGTLRSAYGLHYGEIYPVTYQQVRFSPPGSVKMVVTAPNLIDPLNAPGQFGQAPVALGNLYLLDPRLSTPYSHQYNFSWEPDWHASWKLQLGYVGSRSHKLLLMWYLNRAQAVPDVPQTTATINQRRPVPGLAEIRYVLNGSDGYFDAARATLVVPRWHGLAIDASYWFSKALDLGSAYSNTAYDADSRLSRSQSVSGGREDMKGRSAFDQPHAFLWHASYSLPSLRGVPVPRWLAAMAGQWNVAAILLVKSGTPFNVTAPDGPGYGNVDGNGGDRPNLADPSILGRTIGNPDTAPLRLPRAAFSFMQPTDLRGNLGRNVFRKGGIHNVNAALWRAWPLAGKRTLTFRAESINFLNTPQFAEPGSDLSSPNFGQITNTLNDGRAFRFGLELAW